MFKSHSEKIKRVEKQSYATTKDLYNTYLSIEDKKKTVIEEVKQTRITRAILEHRAILTVGKDYSKTARELAAINDIYTQEELNRLSLLLERHLYLKSVSKRSAGVVACPLGHVLQKVPDVPDLYIKRAKENLSTEAKSDSSMNKVTLYCAVCSRVAVPNVFHCEYCEYDLCTACSTVYCAEG